MSVTAAPRHRADVARMEIREVCEQLNQALTPTLVAALVGVKDPGQARRWAKGTMVPTLTAQTKLRFAYDIWRRVELSEGRRTAQAWFTTANEVLGYGTPITGIREEKLADVAAAAEAFIEGAYTG